MKIKDRISRILKMKKLRCGAAAAVLTIIIVAALALIALGAERLDTAVGLTKDNSFNELTYRTQDTDAVLSGLKSDVMIYIIYQRGDSNEQFLSVLDSYKLKSARVSYEIIEPASSPGLLNKFLKDLDDTLTTGSVIVTCEDTGRYKVIEASDFYEYSYDSELNTYSTSAIRYEKVLTEAIAYVTAEEVPTVTLLVGHGEYTVNEFTSLVSLLTSNNYNVTMTDMLEGDMLSSDQLLMILSPQKDITNDELLQLDDFLKAGGSIIYARSFADPTDLPNLSVLLESYGISLREGIVLADGTVRDDYDGSYAAYIRPYMQETEITKTLLDTGRTTLLMAGASAFEVSALGESTASAVAVLTSGSGTYLHKYTENEAYASRSDSDPSGPFPLAVLGTRYRYESAPSHILAIGNVSMLSDAVVYSQTYTQEFILQAVGTLLGERGVSLDIASKASSRPGLKLGALTPGLIVAILLPLLVIIAAMAVLIPRRHL